MSDSQTHLSSVSEESLAPKPPLKLKLQSEHFHADDICCYPGVITIIQERGPEIAPFRDALLGNQDGLPVEMLQGQSALSSEDICSVTLAQEEWLERTIGGAISDAKLASESVSLLLPIIIGDTVSASPDIGLSDPEKNQLALSRCLDLEKPVLHFDNPFLELSPEWARRYAKRILEVVSESDIICVVTGLTGVPPVWGDSSRIELIEVSLKASYVLDNRQKESDSESAPLHAAHKPELLGNEAIANPHFEELIPKDESEVTVEKRHRRGSGLTRISTMGRFRRSVASARRNCRDMFGARESIKTAQAVLPSKKAEFWFRRVEVKRFLLVLAVVLAVFFLAIIQAY